MGMLDDLMKSVGSGQGGGAAGGFDLQQGIAMVMQLLQQVGGVEGLLAKLQAGGLGEVAQSWIGGGNNQPVSGEQLEGALGSDLMGSLGGLMGGGGQQASSVLAQVLPGLIDQLTPQGRLPQAGETDLTSALGGLLGGGAQGGGLGGLGGLLGGLMRR